MTEYDETLKKIEKAVQSIADESLRRIAFERLLNHELTNPHKQIDVPPPKDSPPRRSAGPNRAKSKAPRGNTPSAVRDEIQKLGISPDENGLPPWNSLGALDKYLWMIEAANKKNVEGLTSTEISFLIYETFKEDHKTNQVNNLKTRIRQAHVRQIKIQSGSTTLAVWQILKGGRQHLETLAPDPGGHK